ncbi:cellulose synthase operon protein YhjU [Raoultella terrigena]|uniref:Cellulose synthase operon protein YhjU n=1 Tax=Raoultella terrigena TaxID=577 RepID=A0A3P8LXT4_RAOTE|nr:cellulose synthase operon protein YhjU [Raoultella terrigena]
MNWPQYTANLPQSAAVSENANAIVIQYQGKPYVQLNGGSWVPYRSKTKKAAGFPPRPVQPPVVAWRRSFFASQTSIFRLAE